MIMIDYYHDNNNDKENIDHIINDNDNNDNTRMLITIMIITRSTQRAHTSVKVIGVTHAIILKTSGSKWHLIWARTHLW